MNARSELPLKADGSLVQIDWRPGKVLTSLNRRIELRSDEKPCPQLTLRQRLCRARRFKLIRF